MSVAVDSFLTCRNCAAATAEPFDTPLGLDPLMMARANGKVMLRNLSRQFERIMELLLMACSVKLEASNCYCF